jgi:uncharacterized tellurite resistance protein B-like protein
VLKAMRRVFEDLLVSARADPDPTQAEHAYQLATATLLVEMTRADFEIRAEEQTAVEDAIRRAFRLSAAETAELVERANAEADHATSLHEFTRLINEHFSPEQKFHVIELLWRVAYADGKIDRYEEHLVRKIAELVYVPHREFIRAKLRARESSDPV